MTHLSPRLFGGLSMAACLFTLSLLTGCGGASLSSPEVAVGTLNMTGVMHGGQNPVSGAHIYLYGAAGYQGASANSILNTTGTGISLDSAGHAYVTTDANGAFTITSDYTCPSYNTSVETYLLAVGGNPGLAAGTNNTAITMVAALGLCNSLQTTTFININEVSTVAAMTALQQFMTDGTHLSTGPNPNTSLNLKNPSGIANAFLTVPNLVDLTSGTALLSTPTGQGIAPQAKLNTLASILAACVNSAGPTSTTCSTLFAAATPSGGTAPTDIATAMAQIAKNPTANISTLYGLASSNPPFLPALTSAPADFSLAITYSGGGLVQPGAMAVDNLGDVYTTNCATCVNSAETDSIVGFSPNGTVLTGSAGYTSHIHKPTSVALDLSDDIWTTNLASGTAPDEVNRMNADGSQMTGWPYSGANIGGPQSIVVDGSYYGYVANKSLNSITKLYGPGTSIGTYTASGLTAPYSVALDGLGNLYASGSGSSNIFKMTTGGTVLSGSGYGGAGISAPLGIAVDGGDHVWTANSGAGTLSEILGLDGTPTSPSTGYTGLNTATAVSIAGDGSAWVANCRASCPNSGSTAADDLVHLSATGTVLATLQDSHLSQPGATVIDPAGNVWIANTKGGTLTEVLGIASPVIANVTYEAANNLLPEVQLLQNAGFEAAGTGTSVPYWTAASGGTVNYTETGGHSGPNRFTQYSATAFTATETQTLTVANGNYLLSCWADGSGGQTTAALTASGYDSAGSTLSTNLLTAATPLTGTWHLYTVPNIPVTSGSLTVNLMSSSTTGGKYMSWDDCTVTKQ